MPRQAAQTGHAGAGGVSGCSRQTRQARPPEFRGGRPLSLSAGKHSPAPDSARGGRAHRCPCMPAPPGPTYEPPPILARSISSPPHVENDRRPSSECGARSRTHPATTAESDALRACPQSFASMREQQHRPDDIAPRTFPRCGSLSPASKPASAPASALAHPIARRRLLLFAPLLSAHGSPFAPPS